MDKSNLWGHFNVTLDDKGRMLLPSKIRSKIDGDKMVLTKGAEQCLWLYLPDAWDKLSDQILNGSSDFSLSTQDVLRRFIAPADEILIDSAGRVKISSSLMKSMDISRECYLLGMGTRLEIWDMGIYNDFERQRSSGVRETWEGLGGHKGSF